MRYSRQANEIITKANIFEFKYLFLETSGCKSYHPHQDVFLERFKNLVVFQRHLAPHGAAVIRRPCHVVTHSNNMNNKRLK